MFKTSPSDCGLPPLLKGEVKCYRETTIEYDKLNRQTEVYMYNDANQLVSTEYAYDYVGNATSVTDPLDNTVSYRYDNLARLTRVTEGGYSTYYTYDNVKGYDGTSYLMNKIIDAKDRVNETYLDSFGNAVVDIDQGDTSTTAKRIVERTFNLNGTAATITQPDGQVDNFTYNNWGQATTVKYGSQTSIDNQTSYTYNAHGQISGMTDRRSDSVNGGIAAYTTTWTYDEIGRTQSSVQDGTTVRYTYDKAGNITSLEQPTDAVSSNTEVTTYSYNDYGQLASVYHKQSSWQNNEKVRDYFYSNSGQMNQTVDYLTFDDSGVSPARTMTTDYTYTALGQMSEIEYTKDSTTTTLEKYTYTYDLVGNIKTETLYNTYGGTTSLTKTYTYDAMYRLTKSVIGTDSTTYSYDKVGNRNSEHSRQTGDYYDKYHYYNEFDQLERVTTNINQGAIDTEEYTYDTRGAMTYTNQRSYYWFAGWEYGEDENGNYDPVYVEEWRLTPWLETDYTYDKAGYLQKTYAEVVNNTTYKTTGHYYNGMEQRVRKTEGNDTTKYIYAGSKLLFTTDGNNAKLTENILTPNGNVIAGQRFDGTYDDKYYFYNTDIRNSTMSILNDNYGAVKYYEYDEYGKQKTKGNSDFINDMTYTGAVTEGGNIFYMNARFYDANNGRFLTKDTYKGNMWEPGSQNLYTYVGNNPINYIDPTGHTREDDERWAEEDPTGAWWIRRQKEIDTENNESEYITTFNIPEGGGVFDVTENKGRNMVTITSLEFYNKSNLNSVYNEVYSNIGLFDYLATNAGNASAGGIGAYSIFSGSVGAEAALTTSQGFWVSLLAIAVIADINLVANLDEKQYYNAQAQLENEDDYLVVIDYIDRMTGRSQSNYEVAKNGVWEFDTPVIGKWE